MLSATLQFSQSKSVSSSLNELGFIEKEHSFHYYLKSKELIEVFQQHETGILKLVFSPGLNLEEYYTIHKIILGLIEKLNAKIDDKESLLGYTNKGEGAYIVTNWKDWYAFLQDAKLRSLEGKKVQLLDENEIELATGMFVMHKTEAQGTAIRECTLITLFGEKTYKGNSLSIQPTNEW